MLVQKRIALKKKIKNFITKAFEAGAKKFESLGEALDEKIGNIEVKRIT